MSRRKIYWLRKLHFSHCYLCKTRGSPNVTKLNKINEKIIMSKVPLSFSLNYKPAARILSVLKFNFGLIWVYSLHLQLFITIRNLRINEHLASLFYLWCVIVDILGKSAIFLEGYRWKRVITCILDHYSIPDCKWYRRIRFRTQWWPTCPIERHILHQLIPHGCVHVLFDVRFE